MNEAFTWAIIFRLFRTSEGGPHALGTRNFSGESDFLPYLKWHPAVMLIAFLSIAFLCSAFAAEVPRELHDDFEHSQLASFWLAGDYGSGLYAPAAVKVSTNYARSGNQSLEVTVRKGDVASPGSGDTMTERADLDSELERRAER